MKIAFRADASAEIGTGHVYRCLVLTDTLRARGAQSRFVCRRHDGNLLSQIEARGMRAVGLPAPAAREIPAPSQDYSRWLGAGQETDAAETEAALEDFNPDWIVVDHYGIDARWEKRVRSLAPHLMAIDDLASRQHTCELLLDQNFSLNMDARYAGLVPLDCKLLLGPRFALLSEEYARHKLNRKPPSGQIGRVFVFFGGTDPHNLTGAALEALSNPALRHLRVDVVVGINNPHLRQLQQCASGRSGITLHQPRPHLADLMSEADLALGAAGTTTWERMCLGIPSVVVATAENQLPGAEALAEAGLIEYLGPASRVAAADFLAALGRAISGGMDLSGQSQRGGLAVDGLGAHRVAECIDPTLPVQLTLRDAQLEDAGLFFNWVNEREVRRQSLNSEGISWSSHQQWFRSKVGSRKSRLFVLLARTLPVGQIRFDMDNDTAEIGFSVDPVFRGRGWGRMLVGLGMKRMLQPGRMTFRARVKQANPASAAVFERLGFRKSAERGNGDVNTYYFDSGIDNLANLADPSIAG